MIEFLLIIFSYIIGSIPTGYIIAKTKGIDITKTGSGNIGMANVMRTLGVRYGILVLILDSLKGFIPTFIAIKLNLSTTLILLVALVSILGHIFTIFLKFKGGKGVATALGTIFAISPITATTSLIVWIITVIITRYSSLGSILGSITALILVILYQVNLINIQLFNIKTSKTYITIFTFLVCLFIIYKHKDNLKRIIQGKENKLF